MKLNRTTKRAVDILVLASKKPEGITLEEICESLALPRTSAYDIATTLVCSGMLHVTKEQKQRYSIGLMAYRIGITYTNNLDFLQVIEPKLKAFSKEVGKTVFFGMRSGDAIVYIRKFEPENPIITTATVGTRNALYATSLGKAIIAHMRQPEREELLGTLVFKAFTQRTIRDRDTLEKELAVIRSQGYAVDNRELEEHMACVGAPVFGQDGNVLGAISVSGLYMPGDYGEELGRQVREKALELSELLGYLDAAHL